MEGRVTGHAIEYELRLAACVCAGGQVNEGAGAGGVVALGGDERGLIEGATRVGIGAQVVIHGLHGAFDLWMIEGVGGGKVRAGVLSERAGGAEDE